MSTLYSGDFLRIEQLENNIVELCLDNRKSSVNTLSIEFREDLRSALKVLPTNTIKGLILSSAKPGFLAGANISELETLLAKSPVEQIEFCENTADVLCQLENLPFPSVSAIAGFALGGGLELALCTDYRVATNSALLGFPEVGLGVLPGVGGTVKAPRLAGFETGLSWLTSGRQFKGDAALDAGMVDGTAAEDTLRDISLALLNDAISGKLDWQKRRSQRGGNVDINTDALANATTQFKRMAKHYPAADAICQLLERGAPLNRNAALKEEAACFSQLAQSTTAKALVAVYQAQQSLKKKNKNHANKEIISKAGVLGAGIMGGGIAYTTALRGTPVIIKDIQQSAVDLGLNEARKLLGKQVSQQRINQEKADTILSSIKGQLDFSDFDSLDIIAEAVVEKLEIKQAVLAETAKHSRADTVLASNTSSLRISDIAKGLENPTELVGMHFFNPVHMMPLVEVVKGPQSSDQAVAKTIAYALQMGKTPLLVKDCAGFLINRILGAYFAAFSLLIRDGVDFRRIDSIMTAWGLPMGPAYLLDVAGLDTLDKAMRILGEAYPDVMAADFETAIVTLANAGRYGQKTGAGFYQYQADDKGRPQRCDDPQTAILLAPNQHADSDEISDQDIEDRLVLAMLLEASRCLKEGISESAEDIDTGMRLGTGFPAHFCGPLWYADNKGSDWVLAGCARFASLGGLYTPDIDLIEHAKSKRAFYA